ncbi:NECA1 protein, partial [Nothocercus nigrocapillus]|nr:NECA1 protein [Nothocercus nigrocapillus]
SDDGKLSFNEFKAYFADGILSGEELHELFHAIDTHKTELSVPFYNENYFSQHLGEYGNVLSVLEDLHITVLKAMDRTKKDYQEASNLEQFVTRFLLKETLTQLQSLQGSLDCAVEQEEQTRQASRGPPGAGLPRCLLSVQWPGKHSAPRLLRNNSLLPSSPHFNTGMVFHISGTLRTYVHTNIRKYTTPARAHFLTCRADLTDLKLEPFEEVLEENARSHILIVRRQMSVLAEEMEAFRLALKQYVARARVQGGCLHVSIQKLSNDSRFVVYEFWESSSTWN